MLTNIPATNPIRRINRPAHHERHPEGPANDLNCRIGSHCSVELLSR